MATVNELRSVLLDLEHDEMGDADVVWAEVEARLTRRPRRLLIPLIAAALVLMVAGVGFALTSHSAGKKSVSGPASPSATMPVDHYVFTIEGLPAGYTFILAGTMTDVQGARVSQGSKEVAAVNIGTSPAAMGVPPRPADASDIAVRGVQGYFAHYNSDQYPGLYFAVDRQGYVSESASILVWHDPSGVWVAIQTDGLDRASALQVADAVQVGVPTPVRIMARFNYLPKGLALSAIGTNNLAPWTDIEFGAHDSQLGITIAAKGQLSVSTPSGSGTPKFTKITIGAFSGMYDPDNRSTLLTSGKVDVLILFEQGDPTTGASDGTHAMPLDELTKLIKGMTIASDPNNQATWFDAADALPH